MPSRRHNRLISVTALAFGSVLVIVSLPLLSLMLFAVDIVRDRRFPLLRAYLLVVFYALWEVLGVLGAVFAWAASGVWMGVNRSRFLDWNYALQRWWAFGFAWVGIRLFSLQLNVAPGGYVFGDRPVILLVRHTSLADTILATYLVTVQQRFRMRYVMKRELLWDPCLDIVGNRLPNYFVDRRSANTLQEAKAIAALAEKLGPREGVIIWPEATRFSARKQERALARLASSGESELLECACQLRYVLPPRLGGIMALLECNPEADVVFCAHTGFEHAASFRDIFGGSMIHQEIRAKFWGYAPVFIPRDNIARKRWIYENWRRVDEFVAEGTRNGEERQAEIAYGQTHLR